MRVYIPGSVVDLGLVTSGQWEPQIGYAATDMLLGILDLDDLDEVAEIVRDVAALASVVEFGSPLRLVLVADLSRAELEPAPEVHPGAVRLTERVPVSAIACAFVDERDAAEDVRAAESGDEEALVRLEERDLLWYDVSELSQLAHV